MFAISVMMATISSVIAQQTTTITGNAPKIYVGAGFEQNYADRLLMNTVIGNPASQPVHFNFAPAIPGITPSFSTNDMISSDTNSLSLGVTNALPGVYPFTVSVSNTSTATLITNLTGTLIIGKAWVGNVTLDPDASWSNVNNWTTTNATVNGDDVTFQNIDLPQATQTNYLNTSLTLNSLSVLLTGDTTCNMGMAPGTTLTVVGTNGFVMHSMSPGVGKKPFFFVDGVTSSLVISNQAGDFSVGALGTSTAGTTMNLTNLGRFVAVVNRFGLGATSIIKAGPTYGYSSCRNFLFARTNFIKTSFVGDYSGLSLLTTAITFANQMDIQGQVVPVFDLGISNVFYGDSVGIGLNRVGSTSPGATVQFNKSFTNRANFNPIAIFRGAQGTNRVSLVAIGADSGTTASPTTARGILNLGAGDVDMLADTIWVGHSRTNGSAASFGTFNVGGGVVDVNTLRLGYKQFSNSTTSATGTMTVNTNGIVRVNNVMEMGGALNLTGGAVQANTITLGQPGINNSITLRAGGSLAVTNGIADATNALGTLDMDDSQLTLNIDGSNPNPLVYVTNFVNGTLQCALNIASIKNVTSYPVTIPLIKYELNTGYNMTKGTLPPGINGILNDNTGTSVIEITLTTAATKTLVWRGTANANWDTTSINWLNTSNSTLTSFTDGDKVIFDNTAAVPTTINVPGSVYPAQIIVTNTVANSFVFTGAGSILGNALLTKTGSAGLAVNCYSDIAAQINQGPLTGSGRLGSATIASGASINFSGTINGSLSCASANALVSGTVGATVFIQNGGVLTNSGTFNNLFSMSAGSYFRNQGTVGNNSSGGSTTIPTNSTLFNSGTIHCTTMGVSGTLIDTGASGPTGGIWVHGTAGGNPQGVLTINSGGVFKPGGDSIGTNYINDDFSFSPSGRLVMANNSTNIFQVKPGVANDTVSSAVVDFGSSSATPGPGCIILMTNVGPNAYAIGQSFQLFVNKYGGNLQRDNGNATNAFPIILPSAPASGLAWDTNTLRVDGILHIVAGAIVNTNPPIVATSSTVTSNSVISIFQWPSDHIGWRLQTQHNPLTVGISNNWADINGTAATNYWVVTNAIGAPQSVFFRLTY